MGGKAYGLQQCHAWPFRHEAADYMLSRVMCLNVDNAGSEIQRTLNLTTSPSAALSNFSVRAFVARADFCSYASLYHQKQMLTDHRRMQAYYSGERREAADMVVWK